MGEKNNKYRGFSLLEISVVVAILSIFSAVLFWNLSNIASISRAKECSKNLMMLNQAIRNYSLDNNVSYGVTIYMTNLISKGYLSANESYVCPVNKTPYQAVFTNGILPVCPDGILNHKCSID